METDGPPHASGTEARAAVEDVLRDQAEKAKRRSRGPRAPRDRRPALSVVAVLLVVATAWVLRSPPSFLRPSPPSGPPPAAQAAGLRMTVYVAVLRVNAFRDRAGRLPDALAEVFEDPEDLVGLTYERLDAARFRLTGVHGDHAVSYESGDDLRSLVGDARRVLGGAR